MNKAEFLSSLEKELSGLSAADTEKAIEYYSEMIDDRIESGMSEESAVADVGTPEAAAKDILMDMPIAKVVKAKMKKQRGLKGWEIALIILGAPLWIPILIVMLAVALSVVTALFSIVITFAAVVLALVFGGLFCIGVGIWELFRAMFASGLFGIGIGIGAIGCGILAVLLTILAFKLTVWLLRVSGKAVKAIFVGKGEA